MRKQSSDALHAIEYAMHRSRSHDAVIRVYDGAGKVIVTHDHTNEFRASFEDFSHKVSGGNSLAFARKQRNTAP